MEDAKKNIPPQRRSALGRGLSAILPGAEELREHSTTFNNPGGEITPPAEATAPTGAAVGTVAELPIAAIETNPGQPRTYFDETALNELADSIRLHGVIQPITVRKLAEGSYQLISGERRLQASRRLGRDTIPAYIRQTDSDDMLALALIENVQREDLNPLEVALAYKRLMEECNLTLEAVGDRVGKKRATVNNYVRLLKLPPEIQSALRDNRISMGHARALISVDNPVHQLGIFKKIVNEDLSVRETEALVAAIGSAEKPKPEKAPKAPPTPFEIQLRSLTRDLENRFNTRVQIDAKPEGPGEIRLKFYTPDDLNRLLELLK